MLLNQNHTVCPKIETEFLGKLGNSNVFSAQKQMVSKKKKKVFTEIETDFPAKIGNPNAFSGRITTCTSRLRHPLSFEGGGLFSIFHQKSASKAPKTCDFAYFTSQWGGGARAPPGDATGYRYFFTLYSPSCLGQERAKEPFGFSSQAATWSKCLPHRVEDSHCLLILSITQESRKYQFLKPLVGPDRESNPQAYRSNSRRSIHSTTDRFKRFR